MYTVEDQYGMTWIVDVPRGLSTRPASDTAHSIHRATCRLLTPPQCTFFTCISMFTCSAQPFIDGRHVCKRQGAVLDCRSLLCPQFRGNGGQLGSYRCPKLDSYGIITTRPFSNIIPILIVPKQTVSLRRPARSDNDGLSAGATCILHFTTICQGKITRDENSNAMLDLL